MFHPIEGCRFEGCKQVVNRVIAFSMGVILKNDGSCLPIEIGRGKGGRGLFRVGHGLRHRLDY